MNIIIFVSEKIFEPLLKIGNNAYKNTTTKKFSPIVEVSEYTDQCVIWAASNYFKPGKRTKEQILINAIQGKYAEFGLYKYFYNLGYSISPPDVKIRGKGEWDDGDLFLNGMKIQVKSSSHYGNLLLLKKGDWTDNGEYKHSVNGLDPDYKGFFYCRLNINLKKELELDPKKEIDTNEIIDFLSQRKIVIDCPGFIKIEEFRDIIKSNLVLKKGSIINPRVLPDKTLEGGFVLNEDNYYCQSQDLIDIDVFKRIEKNV